jgi:hypothetical protein
MDHILIYCPEASRPSNRHRKIGAPKTYAVQAPEGTNDLFRDGRDSEVADLTCTCPYCGETVSLRDGAEGDLPPNHARSVKWGTCT